MFRVVLFAPLAVGTSAIGSTISVAADDNSPAEPAVQLTQRFDAEIARTTDELAAGPDDKTTQKLYSQRGDAHFFHGQFDQALADYDKLLELTPSLEPFHWRRGLALYYTGRYTEAARQFEKYFEHDQSDRENGIWRFYAQAREHGLESARNTMLPYEKPDRALLPEVYLLCAGSVTPAELEAKLNAGDVSDAERQARQFYGHLYLGLDSVLKENVPEARRHLKLAVASDWPQTAGYGPRYMWHVARLELARLPSEESR